MVTKAVRAGWPVVEVDVDYLPRTGRSKVTGEVQVLDDSWPGCATNGSVGRGRS